MKDKIGLLFFLFCSFTIYSQKNYSFNYIIEYNFQKNETSKPEKRYLLTNSEDDSYSVYVYEEDNLNFKMDFKDEKGIRSISTIDKNDFFKAETMVLSCENIQYQKDKRKYDSARFDFINKKDTLINGISYQNYEMKYRKNAESKRYNRGISNYIVENNTDFHPPLMMFSSIFDVSATSKNRPNGIAKEIFSLSHDKKQYEFIYKLSQFAKIQKFLEIPAECD
ncbi:hypothetical protein [Flavobacterium caseinilyticum]|uniref:GLPGLI family protein n=1 Tax=Flavobacterium caseinilyticum TaxID=2541732 RepID=A0A4R5AWQ9_9FLAO|nr:hypothetical protein [Flavobacterium caseinilyticum]TDD77521.1 hypothetical protein E0F89_08030 [Flavobacterium caseinilyticum]